MKVVDFAEHLLNGQERRLDMFRDIRVHGIPPRQ